jgi:hypothetical protein
VRSASAVELRVVRGERVRAWVGAGAHALGSGVARRLPGDAVFDLACDDARHLTGRRFGPVRKVEGAGVVLSRIVGRLTVVRVRWGRRSFDGEQRPLLAIVVEIVGGGARRRSHDGLVTLVAA